MAVTGSTSGSEMVLDTVKEFVPGMSEAEGVLATGGRLWRTRTFMLSEAASWPSVALPITRYQPSGEDMVFQTLVLPGYTVRLAGFEGFTRVIEKVIGSLSGSEPDIVIVVDPIRVVPLAGLSTWTVGGRLVTVTFTGMFRVLEFHWTTMLPSIWPLVDVSAWAMKAREVSGGRKKEDAQLSSMVTLGMDSVTLTCTPAVPVFATLKDWTV